MPRNVRVVNLCTAHRSDCGVLWFLPCCQHCWVMLSCVFMWASTLPHGVGCRSGVARMSRILWPCFPLRRASLASPHPFLQGC